MIILKSEQGYWVSISYLSVFCRRKTPNSGKKQKVTKGSFTKEVILLPSPVHKAVVKQGVKQELYQLGHILSAVELRKEWTAEELLHHIRKCFNGKIPDGIR